MPGISITWNVDSSFDDSEIREMLKKFGLDDQEITNEYQKWVNRGLGLIITRYEEKIVAQGTENNESLNLIKELSKVEGLRLGPKNAEKFAELFRVSHNALFCMDCNTQSMVIKGEIEGLDIVFKMQCGHQNKMSPPLFMLTSRILPDINILVGGHLSRCIDLGYFNEFEIVIPHFVTQVIDNLGDSKKAGASKEIERLEDLENEGKITIFNFKDAMEIPHEDEINQKEDDIILEIANITNSILFTGDSNLKHKAVLDKRPTIYIHPKDSKNIKFMAL